MNLPPLPKPHRVNQAIYAEHEDLYTADQVRHAQREAVAGPDGWEANAQFLLDKCPYTVWQRPGAGPIDRFRVFDNTTGKEIEWIYGSPVELFPSEE